MHDVPPSGDEADAPPGPHGSDSLTQRTSRGFTWMVGQTLGSKLIGILGQVVLARLLLPQAYGLIALAYGSIAFAGIVRQTGVQQILIRRQKNFNRWANAAFWMEMAASLAGFAAMVVAAPVAAIIFHSSELAWLVLIIASSTPLTAPIAIPSAKLMIDMRFEALALINLSYNLGALALSILLAWLNFGAYSFAIPLPIMCAFRAAAVWLLAGPRIRLNPQFRRWRYLLGDSGMLIATDLFNTLAVQADSLSLGLFRPKYEVGIYFFASNLSSQVSQLLATNLGTVLLPALSSLQGDRQRQVSAYFRAARLMAIMAVPVCMLEAAVARPVVLFFYGARWLPAVATLQVLALMVAVTLPARNIGSLLQSQGRYKFLLRWTAARAALYAAAALVGAWSGGPAGVAVAFLGISIVFAPLSLWLATRRDGASWRDVRRVYLSPTLAGAVALAPAVALGWLVPGFGPSRLLSAVPAVIFMGTICPWVVRRICPDDFGDLASQAVSAVARLRRQRRV